ncbi:MAG: phage shock protein PspA [Gammaproteobacteria bacterium]|nr:phage shock protein PspA [Gammaproteobacteria bacterium]MDE0224751.1 phage shock protein PspA [Gammaproteobacteria bacterium]MDE0451238.1 phage shock protein PspA [Gammaproteobacteria bacterium]
MGIFSRATEIVNSNLNALLDKAENPEKMVRLIIQEMEETLVEVRTTSARAIADRKTLARRQASFEKDAAEWERKAELAIRKDRDDLARGALAERARAEAAAEALAKESGALEETLAKLNGDMETLQAKLKDAKARQNAIVMRGEAARGRLDIRRQLSDHSVDDAMLRFEQYESRIDDLEGQVESYDVGQKTLAAEIDSLEGDEQVDEELRRLKERVQHDEQSRDDG